MKFFVALAVAAGMVVGAQAVTATSVQAGGWCGEYHVYYPSAPYCSCRPYFGYYKSSQYWPAPRMARVLPYYRLESYRMVKPRRR